MSKLIYQFVCQCLPHKNYRRRAVVKWVWAPFPTVSTESQELGAETAIRANANGEMRISFFIS